MENLINLDEFCEYLHTETSTIKCIKHTPHLLMSGMYITQEIKTDLGVFGNIFEDLDKNKGIQFIICLWNIKNFPMRYYICVSKQPANITICHPTNNDTLDVDLDVDLELVITPQNENPSEQQQTDIIQKIYSSFIFAIKLCSGYKKIEC